MDYGPPSRILIWLVGFLPQRTATGFRPFCHPRKVDSRPLHSYWTGTRRLGSSRISGQLSFETFSDVSTLLGILRSAVGSASRNGLSRSDCDPTLRSNRLDLGCVWCYSSIRFLGSWSTGIWFVLSCKSRSKPVSFPASWGSLPRSNGHRIVLVFPLLDQADCTWWFWNRLKLFSGHTGWEKRGWAPLFERSEGRLGSRPTVEVGIGRWLSILCTARSKQGLTTEDLCSTRLESLSYLRPVRLSCPAIDCLSRAFLLTDLLWQTSCQL